MRLEHALIAITFVVAAMVISAGCADAPSNCRFYVVSQYNWEGKLGFYLDFEGSTLSDLPVILGVADGKDWRFAASRPGFVADRDYTIRAIIAPDGANLYLGGKLIAESPGAWQPATGRITVNERPSWASEPGDWLAVVRSSSLAVARGDAAPDRTLGATSAFADDEVALRRTKASSEVAGSNARAAPFAEASEPKEDRAPNKQVAKRDFDFSQIAARSVPLQLFEPGWPDSAELATAPGDTVTLEVSMRFANGDLKRWAPFIDAYEQCRYADWPEKVRNDDDLRGDIAREDAELAKTPPSRDYDDYGGYL